MHPHAIQSHAYPVTHTPRPHHPFIVELKLALPARVTRPGSQQSFFAYRAACAWLPSLSTHCATPRSESSFQWRIQGTAHACAILRNMCGFSNLARLFIGTPSYLDPYTNGATAYSCVKVVEGEDPSHFQVRRHIGGRTPESYRRRTTSSLCTTLVSVYSHQFENSVAHPHKLLLPSGL